MKTPRLVRGVFFALRNPRGKHKTCGSWIASPTRFVVLLQDEAFVMKLKSLRLNVADFAGCRSVSIFARNPFQFQSFT